MFSFFIRDEKRRRNEMTSARYQPFCTYQTNKIGCFDGSREIARSFTERDIAFYINKNLFCLNWKSDSISFNKTIEELQLNSKAVDNCISDEHVTSFIEKVHRPKKVQSQLTYLIVYVLETSNNNRCVPYSVSM